MHGTSGILLHPTSLPGPDDIGDLGPAAYRFLDWLAAAGQGLWQMLPLGPTGYRDSPLYQCTSAFSGNTLLISLALLREAGWLDAATAEADRTPAFPAARVDHGAAHAQKDPQLRRPFEGFEARTDAAARASAANRPIGSTTKRSMRRSSARSMAEPRHGTVTRPARCPWRAVALDRRRAGAVLTEGVNTLRDVLALPGMAILQLAFEDPSGGFAETRFLPHNHRRRLVVYTGTHDNDTLLWD